MNLPHILWRLVMDMPAKMVVVKDRDKKYVLTPWRGEVNWSKKFMFRHFKFKGCSENRKCGAFLKKRSFVQLTTFFQDCFCMWWCNLFWSPNFLYSISFEGEILEKQFLAQCHVELHFCKRFNCENQIWAANPSLNSIRKHC